MLGQMEVFGISDTGRHRSVNNDQFMIAELCKSLRVHSTSLELDQNTRIFGDTQGRLLLVADVFGNSDAGGRASQLALDGVIEFVLNNLSWYLLSDDFDQLRFQQQLREGLRYCRSMIDRQATLTANHEGMTSTMTLAYVVWPRMFVVHEGNSRCYLLRGGRIEQLTKDQTTHQQSISDLSSSKVAEDEFRESPSRVLQKIVGEESDPNPEATSIDLQIGDSIVLCTDGLTVHLSDQKINETISSDTPLSDACSTLVAEANELGGSDNITLVACRFRLTQPPEAKYQAEEVPFKGTVMSCVDVFPQCSIDPMHG